MTRNPANHQADAGPQDAKRRPRPAMTAESLERWALRYLDRYATSTAHLRRLMQAKIERVARLRNSEPAPDPQAVEALLRRLTDMGLLDDRAYAMGRARALHRRGVSPRGIHARLRAKGVPGELTDAALATLDGEVADLALAAALRYARRRRLGPYRPDGERAERRARDLAALDRQGFGYAVACRVIDAEDLDELEQEAEAQPT